MKNQVIVIQNDGSSTGKTFLTRALSRFLIRNGVPHRVILFSEDEDDVPFLPSDWLASYVRLDPGKKENLIERLADGPSVTLIEVGTGLTGNFKNFLDSQGFLSAVSVLDLEVAVVIPIASNDDEFDAVLSASQTYGEAARYVVARTLPEENEKDYEDDGVWDRSYAARVMDMLAGVEIIVPELRSALEPVLRKLGLSPEDSLLFQDVGGHFGQRYAEWLDYVDREIHSARVPIFGEGAKNLRSVSAVRKKRPRKTPKRKSRVTA